MRVFLSILAHLAHLAQFFNDLKCNKYIKEGDCEYFSSFSSSSFYSTILIFQICNAISMSEHASTRKLICVFAHFADLAYFDQSLFLTFRGNR